MQNPIIAGRTLRFTTTLPGYPASDGWTLAYRLVPRTSTGTGTAIDIVAIASGDDYLVDESPATTGTWLADNYSWESSVSLGTGTDVPVFDIDYGQTVISPDPSTATALDNRTRAEKALDDAKDALATFNATGGKIKRYSIAGREMEFQATTDITAVVDYWQAEVTREHARKKVAKGLADPRRIIARSSRGW